MSKAATILRKSLGAFVLDDNASLEKQRSAVNRLAKVPAPRGTKVRELTVGGVRSLRIVPPGEVIDGHVMFLHGGGYCIGSPETHKSLAARLGKRLAMPITSVDYRLTPEHAFPAGLDDCLAAYEALCVEFPKSPLFIVGDSAGGGATLATLLRIRDRGLRPPNAAVMFSPWIDLTGTSASMKDRASRDPMLRPQHLEQFAKWYAGQVPRTHTEVSPLFADLNNLPPMLVQVGTEEVLYSDSETLVERVGAAGGEATLDVAVDMWHVYQVMAPALPEANAALQRAMRFILQHTKQG
jgi:epsilon-lactone hydrolase